MLLTVRIAKRFMALRFRRLLRCNNNQGEAQIRKKILLEELGQIKQTEIYVQNWWLFTKDTQEFKWFNHD